MPLYRVNVPGGDLATTTVATNSDDIKTAFALDMLQNTSDLGKPVTTALTAALVPFVDVSAVGEALNNAPVLEFNFKEDQYVTKNTVADWPDGTLIHGKAGPPAEFTRASGATYKDHVGILRYAPENLTPYSYTFQNAHWDSSAYVTEADGTATDPFGVANNATTITQVTDGSTRARHIHEATGPYTPVIDQTYCMSVYIKQHETTPARYFQLAFWSGGFGATAFKNFDIETKTVSTGEGGSSILSSGIETLSDGWMRIFITAPSQPLAPATAVVASGFQLAFVTSLNASRAQSYVLSSGAKSAYIHGAQVERSTAPRKYLSTTSSIVYGPRFHYDSVANESLGLIFEEQKTNFAHVNSGTIPTAGCSATRNYTLVSAPDGSFTTTRVASVPNSGAQINYISRDTIVDGQYTRSFFVKALSNRASVVIYEFDGVEAFYIVFNLISKTFNALRQRPEYVVRFGYEDYGNGWIRVWLSSLKTATQSISGNLLLGWWGIGGDFDVVNDILFWGPQLEAGYVMTSYIPNSATQSLTRSADNCGITGTNFSNFYNAAAGTLCVDYRSIQYGVRSGDAGVRNILSVNDGTISNAIVISVTGGSNSNSDVNTQFNIITGGTSGHNGISSAAQGVLRKTAITYSNNSCTSIVNGSFASSVYAGTLPTVNQMSIGNAVEVMNISAVRYYKQKLSNTTIQTLTSL